MERIVFTGQDPSKMALYVAFRDLPRARDAYERERLSLSPVLRDVIDGIIYGTKSDDPQINGVVQAVFEWHRRNSSQTD